MIQKPGTWCFVAGARFDGVDAILPGYNQTNKVYSAAINPCPI